MMVNPSQTEFEIFLNNQINQKYPNGQEEGDLFGNILRGAIKSVATQYLKESTTRNNYLLFSTYTVNLTGIQSFVPSTPPSASFIGILGTFIPTSNTKLD